MWRATKAAHTGQGSTPTRHGNRCCECVSSADLHPLCPVAAAASNTYGVLTCCRQPATSNQTVANMPISLRCTPDNVAAIPLLLRLWCAAVTASSNSQLPSTHPACLPAASAAAAVVWCVCSAPWVHPPTSHTPVTLPGVCGVCAPSHQVWQRPNKPCGSTRCSPGGNRGVMWC